MITSRTYPQPDAPELEDNARFRALAVFKYLLNLEPEAASRHPMFVCIQHAFEQQGKAYRIGRDLHAEDQERLDVSVVEQLSGAPTKS